MRVWALTSWFDEDPEWLSDMVASCAGLCAGVIALDGRYPLYPDAKDRSPAEQSTAIIVACEEHAMTGVVAWAPPLPEVEKRTRLFEMALGVADPLKDWFLIMDGDMILERCEEPAVVREELARTTRHAAAVASRDVPSYASRQPLNAPGPIPFLVRALPGLRCLGRHSIWTAPDPDTGRPLWLWSGPHGYFPEEPLDLTRHVLLHHFPYDRADDRNARRHDYYVARGTAGIEFEPGPFADDDPPWMVPSE